jgi:hypothetical protein
LSYAQRYARRQLVDGLAADLDAVEGLLAGNTPQVRRRSKTDSTRGAEPPRSVEFAGRASLMTAADARAFVKEVSAARELLTTRPDVAYASARRFPRGPGSLSASELSPIGSLLDRVDVILAVAARIRLPRAWRLLHSAHSLLGHVLRDEAHVAYLLTQQPIAASATRHALFVALGLLGRCPSTEFAVAPSNAADVRAFLLATLLADLDRGRTTEHGLALAGQSRGVARRVVGRSLARLQGGAFLGLIE